MHTKCFFTVDWWTDGYAYIYLSFTTISFLAIFMSMLVLYNPEYFSGVTMLKVNKDKSFIGAQ